MTSILLHTHARARAHTHTHTHTHTCTHTHAHTHTHTHAHIHRYADLERSGHFDLVLNTSSSKLALASILHALGVDGTNFADGARSDFGASPPAS